MPQMKPVTDYEVFEGHTAANNSVDVKAQNVSGYLMKVDFEDGADVKEGDVLFEIDDHTYVADLQNKEALVVQAQRHAERTKANFDRAEQEEKEQEKKNKGGMRSISAEQYDQYRFDWIEAEAALQAAIATRDLSRLNVGYTKVRAPLSGRVGRRMVDPGNFVTAGAAATGVRCLRRSSPMIRFMDTSTWTSTRSFAFAA